MSRTIADESSTAIESRPSISRLPNQFPLHLPSAQVPTALLLVANGLKYTMASADVEVVPLKDQKAPGFDKEKLIKFFMRSLYVIPAHYQGQDPNRLTLLYFTISGLDILGALDKIENPGRIIEWIYSLQVLPPAATPGTTTLFETIAHLIAAHSTSDAAIGGLFAEIFSRPTPLTLH